ncbi:MAG: type 1 glutamine amidotransferase [Acidobacteria bacterium]|nr:type 1 glutamine amidotransferase [Acidobacteriota bacterium]
MTHHTDSRTVAILAADGFEQVELTSPRDRLQETGVKTHIVSLKGGTIQANKHREHGDTFEVDVTLDKAKPSDYDALLIPGGLFSPDALRTDQRVQSFVKAFFDARKPVFAICHGPQVLISAGVVRGRSMTAVKAVQKDLENAGAKVSDEAVVVDAGLVTSRTPDDLDQFNARIVSELARAETASQSR